MYVCMYVVCESAALGEDSADRPGPQHRHLPEDIGGRRAHGSQAGGGKDRHIHELVHTHTHTRTYILPTYYS